VSSNNILKPFRWILNLLYHRKLYVGIPHNVTIRLILFLAFRSFSFRLKARLIEVDFFTHDNRLSWKKHLKNRWNLWIPVLSSYVTSPCSEKTQTHFSTSIKIWVESHLPVSSSRQVHFWRLLWIVIIAINVKLIGSMSIWGSSCSHN